MALILRRKSDGSVIAESDLPDEHEFGTRWIVDAVERGLVRLTLTVDLTDGPVEYQLTGIPEDKKGRPDYKRLRFTHG